MTPLGPGHYVFTQHDCQTAAGTVHHDSPVRITAVDRTTLGQRVRGVRCDGSLIEWLIDEEKTA